VRLVGYPQLAQLDDYARAAEEIETRLGALPGLIAIYSVGAVSDLGISDLDRVAVVSGTGRVPSIWPRLSERTRALAMHPPFLVDRNTFASHRLIAHLEPAELTAGETIEVEEPPERDYVGRVLGAEGILLNLVRLLKYRATGRLKVRAVLCQLHTVRHGLALAGLDRSHALSAWTLADEVASLRRTWFASERKQRDQRLRELVLSAPPALLSALDALASRLPANGTGAGKSLALGDAWAGVTLIPHRPPTPPPAPGRPLIQPMASLSSKTAEAAWRLKHRGVLIPAEVLLLLGGCSSEHAHVQQRRAELLARHREFLAKGGRGYTSIAIGPSLRCL
jgi:hypothetical protein